MNTNYYKKLTTVLYNNLPSIWDNIFMNIENDVMTRDIFSISTGIFHAWKRYALKL